MIVRPDDLLIADLHGVVCLPPYLADKAVAMAENIAAADQKMDKCIENGMSFTGASQYRTKAASAEP